MKEGVVEAFADAKLNKTKQRCDHCVITSFCLEQTYHIFPFGLCNFV